jgi:hypothetical protein
MSYALTIGGTFGMVAEFGTAEEVLNAAEQAKFAGYKKMDAYTPYPVHGLSDAIGFRENVMPYMIFFAGLCGVAFGFTLLWYTSTIDYPLNVGGKPFNSLPSFMPISFECIVLFSALTATFGMLAMNKLPKPYHSIFNTPGFERASQDRFFLGIESEDPNYDSEKTRKFLEGLGPIAVNEVEK